jgi:hypothetical protein
MQPSFWEQIKQDRKKNQAYWNRPWDQIKSGDETFRPFGLAVLDSQTYRDPSQRPGNPLFDVVKKYWDKVPVVTLPNFFQKGKPYQVTPSDKDLVQIAANNGIDYNTLKAANPSITSVSPGQFVNIPPQGYTPGGSISSLQNALQSATDPSQLPPSVNFSDVLSAGYTPEQMTQAGYVLQNGMWRLASQSAPGFQSGNNWQTNPALHTVQFNRNAKSARNRFQTTEKWQQNTLRRKRRQAKGIGGPRTQPGAPLRADNPATTLDVILGS